MAKSAPEAPSIAPDVLAKYEPVIGLEVHVQLLTKTKIFCGCSTRFGDPPNSNVCPVCLGLPGTLPVLNKRAVEMAMRAALALNCTVHDHSRFARKNYFYPDLPKGYQISQYELPLATGGWLEIEVGGEKKRIGITRLHLEEDAARISTKASRNLPPRLTLTTTGAAHRSAKSSPSRICVRPRRLTLTSLRSARSCSTPASAIAIWRKARSVVTPTLAFVRAAQRNSAPRSK